MSTNRETMLISRKLHVGERGQSTNYFFSKLWKYGIGIDILGHLYYLVKRNDNNEVKCHVDQLRRTEIALDGNSRIKRDAVQILE